MPAHMSLKDLVIEGYERLEEEFIEMHDRRPFREESDDLWGQARQNAEDRLNDAAKDTRKETQHG